MRYGLLALAWIYLLLAALPTLKNVVLYTQYEHGREYLDKIDGDPGTLDGTWTGAFDTYQCGIDERHELTFHFGDANTGQLTYRFFGDRIGAVGGSPYDWGALFPYNERLAHVYVAQVEVRGSTLMILPNDLFFTSDTLFVGYELAGDQMHFGYVDKVGETPQEWGLTFSQIRPRWRDLIQFWWS